MIKNIVFDMGNVLVYDDMPAYSVDHTATAEDADIMLNELMYGPEWKEWDRGTMTTDQMVASVNTRLPERLHTTCHDMAYAWHMNTTTVTGIEDLIRQLKAADYGVYLLSNTATTYYAYRQNLPAIELFDGEFVSADHHMVKPYHEIYDTFCSTFNLVAEQCYFIDDTRVNVQGALAAGWGGYWFHLDTEQLTVALREAGVTV
jgi:putative hydrolase of the HAD superfamily